MKGIPGATHRWITILAFAIAGSVFDLGVEACSCIQWQGGVFAHSEEVLLPANAAGVVWWGRLVDPATGELVGPDPVSVSIRKVSGERPLSLTPIVDRLKHDALHPGDTLFLIRPEEGFEPGAEYRFEYLPDFDRRGGPGYPTSIAVRVDEQQVRLHRERLQLDVERESFGELSLAGGAMCTVEVAASYRDVDVEFPDGLERFREAFLYLTRVDRRPWSYRDFLCQVIPTGRSMFSTGSERVYTECPDDPAPMWDGFEDPTIDRRISHTIWLPGTKQEVTLEKSVEIGCPRCRVQYFGSADEAMEDIRRSMGMDVELGSTRFALVLRATVFVMRQPDAVARLRQLLDGVEGPSGLSHLGRIYALAALHELSPRDFKEVLEALPADSQLRTNGGEDITWAETGARLREWMQRQEAEDADPECVADARRFRSE